MKIILGFLLFLIINKYKGQEYLQYYRIINDAEISSLDRNFEKADILYQKAFQLVKKPFKEDYLFAAINSERLNEDEKTFRYLSIGIQNGLTLSRITPKLSSFKKSVYWKVLKNRYMSLHEKHLKTLNITLRKEIEEMIKNDQKVRNPIFGTNKKMKIIDLQNFQKLKEIIRLNDNKWPGFSMIGEISPKGKYDVTDNIVLISLHFDREQTEQLQSYMLEAVLNGEMYPYQYARVIDYTIGNNLSKVAENFVKNKNYIETCFLYGTYLNANICDCKNAEAERVKIGFEPLKDYYRKVKSGYKCL